MAGLHHEQRETQASIRAFTSARTIAMTGLMVGMPRCTGIRTEALTIPNDSCGRLDFTHTFRASTTQCRRHQPIRYWFFDNTKSSPTNRFNTPFDTSNENHSHAFQTHSHHHTQAHPRITARMILISFSGELPDLHWPDERIWPQD